MAIYGGSKRRPNDVRVWVNYRNSASIFGFVWQSRLTCVRRENFLVLDIFFEALNYETIEQKKAYDVAGLLGMIYVSASSLFCFNLNHTSSSLKGFQQTHISEPRRPLTGAALPLLRWHWGTDGPVHRGQHPDRFGNPGLYLWGTSAHTQCPISSNFATISSIIYIFF